MNTKQSHKGIACRAILGLLLTASALLVLFSYSARNATQQLFNDHRDRIDLILSQADDCFLDGKVDEAVALVDKAHSEAHSEIFLPRRRAQLIACAMDYCGYAQKDKALAVLTPVLPYNDATGKQATKVFDSISRGDRMWQPRHVPNATEREQLKALKARLLANPETANHLVGEYIAAR